MLRRATGVMRTIPTKALGIIMDVPPIHVEVQAVAVNASHRLRSLRLWKRRTRHTRLELLKALNDPIICMRGDWMSARIAEEPAWETIFPSREDWLYNRTVYQALENAGIPTGQKPEGCLEQGTIGGLVDGALLCLSVGWPRPQGAGLPDCNLEVGLGVQESPGDLAAKNKVRLIWVPGYMGIKGNEIADRVANLGSRNIPEGLEPIIGLARSQIRRLIMEWTEGKHKEWWSAATGCRQAKLVLGPEPNSDWLRQARNRGREYTRLLTHIPSSQAMGT
uniref:RNase H type-1 domain-containing protein n=1 Tax=Trichogramma kaykai TaxID=54128 RepID=A0ABD2XPX3_9HYME